MIYYTKIISNDKLEVSILEYSISEVSEKMNVTIPTLRYYDNIGLLQKLKKNKSGNRVFTEEYVKNMPLEEMQFIRIYMIN